jgi:hypothetical protein
MAARPCLPDCGGRGNPPRALTLHQNPSAGIFSEIRRKISYTERSFFQTEIFYDDASCRHCRFISQIKLQPDGPTLNRPTALLRISAD